ncbi:hypothetical protein NDU88_003326 [Pleurodeles waltl]|uniref:Uncharacterized protein n=1 Tax=Pleurodeles waltl TaxID=8319 RepID=A0AAV7TN73_PLEWA|nr:hypothetical protein NDU88_003326 [Pleurodeles waltl]
MRLKRKGDARRVVIKEDVPRPDAADRFSAYTGSEDDLFLKNVSVKAEVGTFSNFAHARFQSMPKEIKPDCGGVACQNQNPKILFTSGSSGLPASLVNSMLVEKVLTDVGSSVSGSARPTGENVGIRSSSSAKPSMLLNTVEVQDSPDAAGQPVSSDRPWVELRTGTPVEMKKEQALHCGLQSFTTVLLDGSSSSAHIDVKDSSWATGNKANLVQNFEVCSEGAIKTEIDSLSQVASKTSHSIKTSGKCWNTGEEILQQGQCSPVTDNYLCHQPPRHAGCLSDCLVDMLEEGIFSRLAPPIEPRPVSIGNPSVPEVGGLGTPLVDVDHSQSQDPCCVKQVNTLLSLKLVTSQEKIQDKKQHESNLCTLDEGPTEKSGGAIAVKRGQVRESVASDTSSEIFGQSFPSVDTPKFNKSAPGVSLLLVEGTTKKACKIDYNRPHGDAHDRTPGEVVAAPKHHKFQTQNSPLRSPSSQLLSRPAMETSEETSQLTFEGTSVSNAARLPTTNEENKSACCVRDVTRIASATKGDCLDGFCEIACPLQEKGPCMLKEDGLLVKCREHNAENSSVALAGPQSMDLEEMQLKMSECRVHRDENEAPDAEIEAGTTRAFLEWDGEEPVCNMDKIKQSPSFTEADNFEVCLRKCYYTALL